MLGTNSNGCGECASKVTGVPNPTGARPGEPRPWGAFKIVW